MLASAPVEGGVGLQALGPCRFPWRPRGVFLKLREEMRLPSHSGSFDQLRLNFKQCAPRSTLTLRVTPVYKHTTEGKCCTTDRQHQELPLDHRPYYSIKKTQEYLYSAYTTTISAYFPRLRLDIKKQIGVANQT